MADTDTDTPEVGEDDVPQDALAGDDLDKVSGGIFKEDIARDAR